MKSPDFDSKDLPLHTARFSDPAKPGTSKRPVDEPLLAGGPAQGSSAIDELSDRLVSLANQINQSNTARRSSRPAEFPPSLFRAPARRPEPQAFAREALPSDGIGIVREPPPLLEADRRQWPQLPVPEVDVQALKDRIDEQASELDRRNIEIAELCVQRQTQAGELKIARSEIETQRQSLAELQQIAAQHEVNAAAAAQKLIRAESEKAVLQTQFNEELATTTELSNRLLDIGVALNDKIVDIATHQDSIERLRAELAAALAHTHRKVTEAEEKVDQRHCEERKLQVAGFEKRLAGAQALIAERDRQIETLEKAYAELAGCCDGLSRQIVALEDAQQQAGVALHSQSQHIDFLETMLNVERDNAQATLKALVAEFDRERQEIADRERQSAEFRKNIVLLLPKLAARRPAEAGPEQDVPDAEAQVA